MKSAFNFDETALAQPVGWDVARLVDDRAIGWLQWRLLALFFCAATLDGFDLQSIGFLAPVISRALHFPIASFALIFSAGLFGLGLGSVVIGFVAERAGRRNALLGVLAWVGVLSVASGFVTSAGALVTLRFLTSLGLGGAMPILAALTTEYSPRRVRSITVCLLCAAIPMGGLAAGLVGAAIMPTLGWRAVFYIGGVAPLILVGTLGWLLPHSVEPRAGGLSLRNSAQAWAGRLWPRQPAHDVVDPPVAATAGRSRGALLALFTNGSWRLTPLIWLCFFMSLMVLYFVINWVPALLNKAGFAPALGASAIAAFSLGGIIGALVQGPIIRWLGLTWPMVAELLIVSALLIAFSILPLNPTLIGVIVFGLGWSLQGAQAGFNTYVATAYPADLRTTALGWALASGRFGSIVGAMLGGFALSIGWGPRQILLAGVAPIGLCILAFTLSLTAQAQRQPPQTATIL
jgi:AAHS family 4-hydroxybenzoate transporter-like MFS transporter